MTVRKTIVLFFIACGRLMAQAPEEDIRGPKPLVEIPQPEKFPVAMLAGVCGGLLLLVLAVMLWRRLARREQARSPMALAYAELAALEKSRSQVSAETFANRAAGAVREYISARFGIAAPQRTTEEFFLHLKNDGPDAIISGADHLKAFLKCCDLAKFAGSELDALQREDLIQAARGFISASSVPSSKSTKP